MGSGWALLSPLGPLLQVFLEAYLGQTLPRGCGLHAPVPEGSCWCNELGEAGAGSGVLSSCWPGHSWVVACFLRGVCSFSFLGVHFSLRFKFQCGDGMAPWGLALGLLLWVFLLVLVALCPLT